VTGGIVSFGCPSGSSGGGLSRYAGTIQESAAQRQPKEIKVPPTKEMIMS
jgi:hypothetical protein